MEKEATYYVVEAHALDGQRLAQRVTDKDHYEDCVKYTRRDYKHANVTVFRAGMCFDGYIVTSEFIRTYPPLADDRDYPLEKFEFEYEGKKYPAVRLYDCCDLAEVVLSTAEFGNIIEDAYENGDEYKVTGYDEQIFGFVPNDYFKNFTNKEFYKYAESLL